MKDQVKYKTGNVSTGEYFTITSTQKFNTYIKIFDISGFVGDKVIPNKEFKGWK